jgi:hypothetical protein
MKNLVLTALLCTGTASLATGCIIVDGGGDSPNTITASWNLVSGDANTPTGCPAGADTIALISEDSFGGLVTDLFDCADGIGTTSDMPADNYTVWLELTDFGGEVTYAKSLSEVVTVFEDGDSSVGFEFSIDRGAFYMAWEVYESGAPSSCENVGATQFSLTITDANNELYADDPFPCSQYEGTTAGLPAPAPWTMSPAIIDDTQLALAVGDTISDALQYGNEYRDLGLIILDTAAP